MEKSRGVWIGIGLGLALLISFGTPHITWGQTPEPSPVFPTSPSGLPFNLPTFDRFLQSGRPNIDQAVVWLEGRQLFAIAAPAVSVTPQPADVTDPLGVRVLLIEDRLHRIVDSNFDPDTLEVTTRIDASSRQPILYVTYGAGDSTRTDELMTVTTLDAEIHGTDLETWANELTQIIEAALIRARQERQPAFIRQQAGWAIAILATILLASSIISYMQYRLKRERHYLAAQLAANTPHQSAAAGGINPPTATPAPMTTALLHQQMTNRQQKGMNDIQRRVLQGLQGILWGGGIFLTLGLFPYSRWIQPLMLRWLQIPFQILAIAFGTYLLIRLSGVLIDRFLLVIQDSVNLAPERSQRTALRFSTFSRVLKGILLFVLGSSGVIAALSVIGVQVGPLLAGAGIIGLAISFASQSLIKDIINGFFILLEDQYGVGDVITVEDVSGLVENMNLRITQLRNEEGRLITIPNGVIAIVQNLSKEWSRVALQVDVAYSADIDQALMVINQVAQDMSTDPVWSDRIVEKPLLLGVDKLDYTGATVSVWIKTRPLKQWEVAREYRRRLKVAFDRAGISIGVPQQSLWFGNPLDIEEELPKTDKPHDNP